MRSPLGSSYDLDMADDFHHMALGSNVSFFLHALRADAALAPDLAEQYARIGTHFLRHVRATALEVREGVDGAPGPAHGRADFALCRGACTAGEGLLRQWGRDGIEHDVRCK